MESYKISLNQSTSLSLFGIMNYNIKSKYTEVSKMLTVIYKDIYHGQNINVWKFSSLRQVRQLI